MIINKIILFAFIVGCIILFFVARRVFYVYFVISGLITFIIFIIQNASLLSIKDILSYGAVCFIFGCVGLPYWIMNELFFKEPREIITK